MKIVVAGGGAAGLFASFLLARAGHDVVLLEQETAEPPADLESAAAAAFRPSAPQIVQPHIVFSRCRELLIERLPDVHAALLGAGVDEAPLADRMPTSLSDRSGRPGDDRLTWLATRRSTLDWVLGRAAHAEPGITVRSGVRVLGLQAQTVTGQPPHVTGVRTDQGDLAADLVVDATGRRSAIEQWLASIGAAAPVTFSAECGLSYYSRHFRLRRGAELPGPATTRLVDGFAEFTIGIFGADNGAMQLVVAPLAGDRRFRPLKDTHVFTAVLRTVPDYAAWLDVLEPISPVFQMVAPHNSLRRLVVNNTPAVTGLHAIGDSVCTTNPTLGRGLSLAMWAASDLIDVLDEHDTDPVKQAMALDTLVEEHIAPFYRDQAATDAARLAAVRATIADRPPPSAPRSGRDRITFAELRTAALIDPGAFRAFWTLIGMLCLPDDVYTNPEVVDCTRRALASRDANPAIHLAGHLSSLDGAGPTREELLRVLSN